MDILFWIICGIIAGALAKAVVPGEGPAGILGDLVMGIVGALIGGFLFRTFLGRIYTGWIESTLVAFVGAALLLLLLRAISGRRTAV